MLRNRLVSSYQRKRIDRDCAQTHDEMQMRPGNTTCRADTADRAAAVDGIALRDQRSAQVKIRRRNSGAVVHIHDITAQVETRDDAHYAAIGHQNWRADGP